LARAIIGPPLLQARDAMGSLFFSGLTSILVERQLGFHSPVHDWEILPGNAS
jgi:hypothetical protein